VVTELLSVDIIDMKKLMDELTHLREQVKDLQARNTQYHDENVQLKNELKKHA